MTVLKYIFKRFLMMIPTLLGVILILNIILTLAPGDPARLILGNDATVEQLEEFREEHGLNDPFLVRYLSYVGNLLRGDMGSSFRQGSNSAEAKSADDFPGPLRFFGSEKNGF